MNDRSDISLVGQVLDCWESSEVPPAWETVCDFPPGTSPRQQTDALLVDQQLRWERGQGVEAEAYLDRFPQLAADAELRLDLVYGEFRSRGSSTELLEEFRRRFPDLADDLALQREVSTWLDSESTLAETMLLPPTTNPEAFDPAPLAWSDFRLEACLGRGAMGEVHRAVQKSLGKRVALKILKPQHHVPREAVDRFLREARATASLQHPGIVDVHGVGRCPDGGGYFLVMDLVEGHTLQEEIAKGPLPSYAAARAVADVAAAIQHAHERGIVHRDLKPSNVLRTSDGRVVVTDFGLAKLLSGAQPQLSADGAMIGTPQYMAPELVDPERGAVGPPSDVYGLGGLLYVLLTRHPPAEGSTLMKVISQVLSPEPVPRASQHTPGIPSALERICHDCLEKDPARRPPSAAAVRQRLEEWCASSDAPVPPITSPAESSRGRLVWLVGGAVAAGLAVWIATVGHAPEPTRAQPSAARPNANDQRASAPPRAEVEVAWHLEVYPPGETLHPKPDPRFIDEGDRLRLRVELSQPRYVYAYWVGSDRSVAWLGREGPTEQRVTRLSLPREKGEVFPLSGPSGTEVCVLLVRDAPLEDPASLAAQLAPQVPLPEVPAPLADGLPLATLRPSTTDNRARLDHPSRAVGDPEPLGAGAAGAAMAAWRGTWPSELGDFHYLALPRRVQ